MMSVEQVTFKPDRSLIDSNFDGYKLSFEPTLPVFKSTLKGVINEVKLKEEQYSLQHVKCFSLHNHLHGDPWEQNSVYYITDEFIVYQLKSVSPQKSDLEEAVAVFNIPWDPKLSLNLSDESSVSNYNVALKFISEELAVLSNGYGTLYVLKTGNRPSQETWKLQFSSDEFGARRPFLLLDSILTSTGHVECLILRIEDKKSVDETVDDHDDDKSAFISVLDWITLTPTDEGLKKGQMSRLQGSGSLEYAALNRADGSLWLATERKFHFVYDSIQTVSLDKSQTQIKTAADMKLCYAWKQTADEVTVWFKLDEKISKADVDVKLTSTHFLLKLQSSTILEGQLYDSIDTQSSTWIIADDNRLEVILSKTQEGLMWRQLVKGDERGEEILDAELVSQIHQRLAHLTSDKMNPDPQVHKLGDFNMDQLEECDDYPEFSFSLLRYSRQTLNLTHEMSLSSHNWLFVRCRLEDEQLPSLCIRHDVDGLLCRPTDQNQLNHFATFNALGYVVASKQQRKFLSCSPNVMYAALCDSHTHIYIYFQPQPMEGQLRNRKTGQKIKAVAKQKVVTLDGNDDIIGVQVNDKNLFILTNKNIYQIKIVED
ncbi:NudC domain-containing protein 1 [Chamberlinius hualienensis]